MRFKQSDKVVCQNDEVALAAFDIYNFEDLPEKGKVYTIRESVMFKFSDGPEPVEAVYVCGLMCMHFPSKQEIPWNASAFIPLQEAKRKKGYLD